MSQKFFTKSMLILGFIFRHGDLRTEDALDGFKRALNKLEMLRQVDNPGTPLIIYSLRKISTINKEIKGLSVSEPLELMIHILNPRSSSYQAYFRITKFLPVDNNNDTSDKAEGNIVIHSEITTNEEKQYSHNPELITETYISDEQNADTWTTCHHTYKYDGNDNRSTRNERYQCTTTIPETLLLQKIREQAEIDRD